MQASTIDGTGLLRKGSAATILNDDVWLLDGNTLGATKTLGSNDNQDIAFETNGTTRLTIEKDGKITQTGTSLVTLNGNVDATGGLDVTGADLTVGTTQQFRVTSATGSVSTTGNLSVAGNIDLGDVSSDVLTVKANSQFKANVDIAGDLTQVGSNVTLEAGDVEVNLTPGSGSIKYQDAITLNSVTTSGSYVEIASEDETNPASPKTAIITVASTSGGSTITGSATNINLNTTNGNVSIGNSGGSVTLTGNVKGAGPNRFANREKLQGTLAGVHSFTISNSLIDANSVIVMTLESYSGSGMLLHQIKTRAVGSVEVVLSQPLLSGEEVYVNYMIVNQ